MKQKAIEKQYSYRVGLILSTFSSFFGRFLAIFSGILLAKILSPEKLVLFTADQSIVLLGGGLINLGTGQGYRMLVSRNHTLRNSFFLPLCFLRSVNCTVYFFFIILYLFFIHKTNLFTLCIVLGTVLLSMLELFKIDFEVNKKYINVMFISTANGLIFIISAISCWTTNGNYMALVLSYMICVIIFVILFFFLTNPPIVNVLSFNYWNLLKISFPFNLSIILYSFTTYWAITYINQTLGAQQAGFYSVPMKVYQITLVLGMTITGITLPLYHKLIAQNNELLLKRIIERLARGIFLVAGPIVAICVFVPEYLIRVFSTVEYISAASIFPLFGFGILFRLLAILFGNLLESLNRQWHRVLIQGIGAIICIVGVIVIVPKFGITGAAWVILGVDIWLLIGYCLVAKYFAPIIISVKPVFISLSLIFFVIILFLLIGISKCYALLIFTSIWLLYVFLILGAKEEVLLLLKYSK